MTDMTFVFIHINGFFFMQMNENKKQEQFKFKWFHNHFELDHTWNSEGNTIVTVWHFSGEARLKTMSGNI
jgi:hypothetical protein